MTVEDQLYGAPFVTSILLLREAAFVKADVTAVEKSNFFWIKVLLCHTWLDHLPSVTSYNSVSTKLLLSIKVTFAGKK